MPYALDFSTHDYAPKMGTLWDLLAMMGLTPRLEKNKNKPEGSGIWTITMRRTQEKEVRQDQAI